MDSNQRIVRTIPASFTRTTAQFVRLLNVGAYARVSTKKEEQEDSYERQVSHYTKYIKSHDGWRFVDVYADEGITGTRAEKRKDFQRMMDDCRLGKLDKILVKSIARFARNTVDALNAIRELKELGVSVYFENENIDTLSPGGEVLLTILAAMAEQESRTISTNIKWAYQKKFQNGDIQLNYKRFLGYTRDENHNLIIVPEEASVVQRIFREYLYGYSYSNIAAGLTKDGILTPSNKTKWYASVIMSILQNEKYYGGLICGKTYKPDVLSKKRYKNEGQTERYYIENSHPAIISKEEFDLVQAEMRRRWVCPTHKLKGGAVCSQTYLREEEIEGAFLEMLKALVGDFEEISDTLKENIVSSLDDSIEEDINETLVQIEMRQTEMLELLREKRAGRVSDQEYNERGALIEKAIQELTERRVKLESKSNTAKLAMRRVDQITKALNDVGSLDEYNGEIFRAIVENVVVRNTYTLDFHLKVGIVESITITRK